MVVKKSKEIHASYVPNVNLNLNVRGLRSSATLAINERCSELIQQGRTVYKLGLGQSPFPVPAPVVEALRENAHQKDYLPVKGLYALRKAVAEYHERKHGITRTAEDVMIGPGSKELMFLIQLVYYGELVIPTPSWVSYAPQAQIIGHPVRWLQTESKNNWKLLPEELELLCKADCDRPRLLIINYPNNPTGHTYKADELQALADVARRYRMVLLSDEIYGEIHHQGRHTSIAEYYPEGTIISSGLSKWCGAGGWRLGTFTFPQSLRWLMDAMASVASETYTSTSAPIQFAAVRAFQGGVEIEDYLEHCRRILRALGGHCSDKMKSAGIKIQKPQGAFYLFPSFKPFSRALKARGIFTNQDLCESLLNDTGVATIPGASFGRPEFKLTLRAAYVDFDGAAALRAAKKIPLSIELDERFLKTCCGNVLTAMERICNWAESLKSKNIAKDEQSNLFTSSSSITSNLK
ncbi:MAG: pyridoxal phosphate-dependent aminotransferase [bacterium]